MSGPKCGSYTVETAEAREARAYVAAAAEYERKRSVLASLRREVRIARDVVGADVAVPAELPAVSAVGRTSAQVQAAGRSAEAVVRETQQRLGTSVAAATQQRWADQVRRVADVRVFDTDESEPEAAQRPWVERALAELEEIAAAWPVDEPRDVLDRAVEAVGRSRTSSGAALDVTRARDEVGRLRAARRARLERAAAVADLRARLESVRPWHDSTELDAIAARLDDPSADLGTVAVQVERVVAAAHTRRDRDQAAAILTDVLVDMGYTVDEGFSTRLAADGDVLAGRSDWPDHAASVRLDGAGRVYLHVVRADDAAPGAGDQAVDAQFCGHFDALTARAGRRGLRLEPLRRSVPGTRPVRAVDRARLDRVAGTRTKVQLRERQR